MGDRTHVVVIEDGVWRSFYSQWAGYDFELELLAGPEAAVRFAKRQRTEVGWCDERWSAAAAVIDTDARRLLWYSSCRQDFAYRRAVLAVLARTWPGWSVEWAYDGLADIVDYVGVDRADVRTPRTLPVAEDIRTPEKFHAALPNFRLDPETYPPGCELPAELPFWPPALVPPRWDAGILVTLVSQGTVRAYQAGGLLDAVIGNGPKSLATYAEWEPVTELTDFPMEGVHLNADTKSAGLWTGHILNQIMDDTARLWPDWTWEFWQDRYTEQLSRSADAVRLPEPDLADGLRSLAKAFREHLDDDPALKSIGMLLAFTDSFTTAAENAGGHPRTAEDNAFTHTPADMTNADIALVTSTINDLHPNPTDP